MANINLKTNDFNKNFNSKLSSNEYNSYLNNANLVTNNLVDLLKDYYGDMEISVSCTDNQIQTFLEGSISNFIINCLSKLHLNYIDIRVSPSSYGSGSYSSDLCFDYRYLDYSLKEDGTYTIKNNVSIKNLLSSEYDNSNSNLHYEDTTTTNNVKLKVLKHKDKNVNGTYGIIGSVSGWNKTFKVCRLYSCDNQGHINGVGEYTITIPNPSSLDLIFSNTINKGEEGKTLILDSSILNNYTELEIFIDAITSENIDFNINDIIDIDLLKTKGKRMIVLKISETFTSFNPKGLLFTYESNNGILVTNSFSTAVYITVYGRKG